MREARPADEDLAQAPDLGVHPQRADVGHRAPRGWWTGGPAAPSSPRTGPRSHHTAGPTTRPDLRRARRPRRRGGGRVLARRWGDDDGDGGRRGDGEDQANGAGQRPDDLGRDVLGEEQLVGALPGERDEQEDRQRGSGVGEHDGVDGRGEVVAADPHRGGEQLPAAAPGVGGAQLPDGRGLADRHVVEDAERRDEDTARDEVVQPHVGRERLQQAAVLVTDAGQPGGVGAEDAGDGGQPETEHRSEQRGRGAQAQAVRQVEDDEHRRAGGGEPHRDRVRTVEEGRGHEEQENGPADPEADQRGEAAPACDEQHEEDEDRGEDEQRRLALDPGVRVRAVEDRPLLRRRVERRVRQPQQRHRVAGAQPRAADLRLDAHRLLRAVVEPDRQLPAVGVARGHVVRRVGGHRGARSGQRDDTALREGRALHRVVELRVRGQLAAWPEGDQAVRRGGGREQDEGDDDDPRHQRRRRQAVGAAVGQRAVRRGVRQGVVVAHRRGQRSPRVAVRSIGGWMSVAVPRR